MIDLYQILQTDYVSLCVDQPNLVHEVPLVDGARTLSGKWLLVNLVLWKPLIKRGIPIDSRYLVLDELLTEATIVRVHNEIYQQIMERTEASGDMSDRTQIKYEFLDDINELYNIGASRLGRYVKSLSAISLHRTMNQPKIKKAAHLDISKEEKVGIHAVEKKLETTYREALNACKDEKNQPNALYPYLKLKIISEQQLAQVIVAAGTRTDVNDQMITRPILNSYAHGFTSIMDAATDSLAAKKSTYYNAYGMSSSQYDNRKEQLQANTIRTLYRGDCGTQVTIPFELKESMAKVFLGVYIKEGDGLTCLTKSNISNYFDKIIHLRNPLTCLHTDGICHVCGGRITDYMHDRINLGFAATIELMGPTAQLILSNKHFSKTNSTIYMLPLALQPMARVIRNDVYFKENVHLNRVMIGVPFECMKRVDDLQYVEESGALNDQHFSSVNTMHIVDSTTGEFILPNIHMPDNNQAIPYFSSDVLMYIKDNPDRVKVADTIWIDMKDFDIKKPILKCVISNDSMMKFSKKIRSIFTKEIASYTNLAVALKETTSVTYNKVHPHVTHLSVILKSSLITNSIDYRVPVVTDINNVKFGTLGHIIPRRAISSQISYQGIEKYLSEPHTFIIPKEDGILDPYLGFGD